MNKQIYMIGIFLLQTCFSYGQRFVTDISLDTVISGNISFIDQKLEPIGQYNNETTFLSGGVNKRISSFSIGSTDYTKNDIYRPQSVIIRRNSNSGQLCTIENYPEQQNPTNWNDRQIFFFRKIWCNA